MKNPTRGGDLDKGLSKKAGVEIIHLPLQTPKQVDRQNWLKAVRAFRGDEDWERVYQHRLLVSRNLENIVRFPAGES